MKIFTGKFMEDWIGECEISRLFATIKLLKAWEMWRKLLNLK